ncbi:hypothetical protein LCI18_011278 [Fusarium solani-melongenae]|uniref:Uncharacterized protein n=1 Tax=Fusarium solani subsp. cucurbitae TaxID=2747967 RepID=A0ACD3ZG93_FUSSC|nr:hypothetical protein LCI18_011278 [Fusarium solani-melongenae]
MTKDINVVNGEKPSDPGIAHDAESCAPGQVDSNPLQRTETHRNIKSRHAQMIAIGGTIGTGLFVGIGQALAISGPLNLLLAYVTICFFVYCIMTATTEISSYLPIPGSSMAYYGSLFVSKSLGFAMGWLYFYSFGILVAYEITAAALVIDYWPNQVHIAVWITVMLVVIVALNFAPVGAYAETEFWFASTKVFMILGLLILSVVLCFGGAPAQDGLLGFTYWRSPGAMSEYLVGGAAGRFCAFIYALAFSVFSFNFGPELIVITGGEMRAPRKNLPRAAKTFVYRLITFYILGALAIGIICRSDAPGLLSGGKGAAASPWVIAIKDAGIHTLDSIINAGIIISAWSSGNSQCALHLQTLYLLRSSHLCSHGKLSVRASSLSQRFLWRVVCLYLAHQPNQHCGFHLMAVCVLCLHHLLHMLAFPEWLRSVLPWKLVDFFLPNVLHWFSHLHRHLLCAQNLEEEGCLDHSVVSSGSHNWP